LSRPFFFDAGAGRQAQGSGHEGPNFIREFLRIGSSFAHQGSDKRLANSADHQRNGEMWIDVIGNKAVTLRRLEHACAAGELFVGESPLDIEDLGRAAQRSDDKGSEGVVVMEGDIGGYSPSFPVRPAFRRPPGVVENLFIEAAVKRLDNGGDQARLRSKVVIGEPDRNLRAFRDGLHFQMPMVLDQLLLGRLDQSFSCRRGHLVLPLN